MKKFSISEMFISMLKSKMFIFVAILYVIAAVIKFEFFTEAIVLSASQLSQALMIIPVIFILIGLIDVWVDRETMIKYMGDKSGVVGVLVAFMFGTLAAGPLVGAFPLAYIMLKKGARYANVLFFLTIWSSAKVPIILFQVQSMGLAFTVVSNITLISIFLIGSFAVEFLLGKKEIEKIITMATSDED